MLLKNENSTDFYNPPPRLKAAERVLPASRLNLVAEDVSKTSFSTAPRGIFSLFTAVRFFELREIEDD